MGLWGSEVRILSPRPDIESPVVDFPAPASRRVSAASIFRALGHVMDFWLRTVFSPVYHGASDPGLNHFVDEPLTTHSRLVGVPHARG